MTLLTFELDLLTRIELSHACTYDVFHTWQAKKFDDKTCMLAHFCENIVE